jgi:environmental stress-induced protein Ves
LTFPGDAATAAQLTTARARDLNVMVRRRRWRARVRRLEVSGGQALRLGDHQTLLFVAAGDIAVPKPGLTLGPLDAALVRQGAGRSLGLVSASAVAYLVALYAL